MDKAEARPLEEHLRSVSANVIPASERDKWRNMLFTDIQARMAEANRREDAAWERVQSVEDWERFRDQRVAALRDSLGTFPDVPDNFRAEVTGEIKGDGYRVRKLLFETRPGVIVTAHLYLPDPGRESMPGIQIVHSHHRPKEQGELQDMGVNWARTGSVVLVPDMVGHGERAEQPFGGRQDYYSRYFTAMQLHLAGETLIGWMVWDLMRGLDVLLDVPGIDRDRIIMVGAVAGGGDPAAVVAALDPRVTCSIPFNFGAGCAWRDDLGAPPPQGRNLADYAYWECTRNLRLSARDGFFPWVTVCAVAPKPLIYAHEFAWDAESDAAWHRMQKVYELYGASDRLGWSKGAGKCAPGAGNTHCTNVGPVHRAGIYPYLEKWFGMTPPLPEIEDRREPEELACMTDEARPRRRPLRDICADLAAARLAAARAERGRYDPPTQRAMLCDAWDRLLGRARPESAPKLDGRELTHLPGATKENLLLEVEPGVVVPTLLLIPDGAGPGPPVVVGVAQQGKEAFLRERADEIAGLLAAKVVVCLPDVRGTGETRPGDLHACQGPAIRASMDELMLGRTLLGLQLSDLRSVLWYLGQEAAVDIRRLALWGDSFAPINPPDLVIPEQNGKRTDNPADWPDEPYGPAIAEPLGGLLALLGGLFEDNVKAVLVRRCLAAFASTFSFYYFYVPADCVVPGALTEAEICDTAAALAPRHVRLEGLVDACNRAVSEDGMNALFAPTREAYADHSDRLVLAEDVSADACAWLTRALGV